MRAEEAVADAFDNLQLLGYSATLDYSSCYDLMPPDQTCELMRKTGWPDFIVDILYHTWSGMERYIIYEGHCA